jgi:hypothetical protein
MGSLPQQVKSWQQRRSLLTNSGATLPDDIRHDAITFLIWLESEGRELQRNETV